MGTGALGRAIALALAAASATPAVAISFGASDTAELAGAATGVLGNGTELRLLHAGLGRFVAVCGST